MYLTGFADEAANGIEGQIRATKELGWKNIESRNIDGVNIHDIPDEAFDAVCTALDEAGVCINCFGSTIANWGKSIEEPADSSIEETKRAIPRMKRLGTELVRVMSFAVRRGHGPDEQMKAERFARLREIVAMFTAEGLQPVHENCMNYGGMGPSYTLELLENVPGLKLVFDTGNPVFTYDFAKGQPYPKQSSWEFYSAVKDHIAYIHIKDCVYIGETDGIFPEGKFTFPGEGDGDVRRVVADLLASGYDGGISIEPHLSVVFHDGAPGSEDEIRFANYVEYGRRMEKTIAEIRGGS